jgi:hypothetical protein
MNGSHSPPRFVPERPFPPYSFVPGLFPHPIRDPEGHSYGLRHQAVPPVDSEDWSASREYLFGIDLFNYGYYWEAHETWEGLWHAEGQAGIVADLLKGLIQLTAAGVKVRQGLPRGVASLGKGAAELFQGVRTGLGADRPRFLGLDVTELEAFALEVAAHPEDFGPPSSDPVERVLPLLLSPR